MCVGRERVWLAFMLDGLEWFCDTDYITHIKSLTAYNNKLHKHNFCKQAIYNIDPNQCPTGPDCNMTVITPSRVKPASLSHFWALSPFFGETWACRPPPDRLLWSKPELMLCAFLGYFCHFCTRWTSYAFLLKQGRIDCWATEKSRFTPFHGEQLKIELTEGVFSHLGTYERYFCPSRPPWRLRTARRIRPVHSGVDSVNSTWSSSRSPLHYPSVTIHISRRLRCSLLGPAAAARATRPRRKAMNSTTCRSSSRWSDFMIWTLSPPKNQNTLKKKKIKKNHPHSAE